MDTTSFNTNNIQVIISTDSDSRDEILALVLIKLKTFQDSLMEVRKTASITKPYAPPTKYDLQTLHNYANDTASSSQKNKLGLWTLDVLKEFRLSDDWYTPLIILALTNCLPVPPDTPIVLIPSESRRGILDILNRGKYHDSKYPLIAFQYAISRRELQDYLSDHASEYEQLMEGLPKKRRTSADKRTITIGHAVWLLKQSDPTMTFLDILGELNANNINRLITKNTGEQELRNYYNSFLESIKSIYSR